ncbi:MAG TPA: hypothetical protein VGN27_04965 [Gaiellaceae bacterium]|jgi:hypothetical protein|nr:hypothetical protein [Gaiellaceae bacterium]
MRRTQQVEPPPGRLPLPRWVTPVLGVTAVGLLPWTLWLTFSLPARHVSQHYDLAWVGFDIALASAFAATTWCTIRASEWLIPVAAVTGTMLVCDAWFDVVTAGRAEMGEALAEALLAEIPLALLCLFIVIDTERFMQATMGRYSKARQRHRDAQTS